MSRCLWTVQIPFNRADVILNNTSDAKLALPPGSELLELRMREDERPELWFVGDLDEPCADVSFAWVRTGHKVDSRYSFVGLLLIKGSSFGLFVAGNVQPPKQVRMP